MRILRKKRMRRKDKRRNRINIKVRSNKRKRNEVHTLRKKGERNLLQQRILALKKKKSLQTKKGRNRTESRLGNRKTKPSSKLEQIVRETDRLKFEYLSLQFFSYDAGLTGLYGVSRTFQLQALYDYTSNVKTNDRFYFSDEYSKRTAKSDETDNSEKNSDLIENDEELTKILEKHVMAKVFGLQDTMTASEREKLDKYRFIAGSFISMKLNWMYGL